MYKGLKERFLQYVKIDTQSQSDIAKTPSTEKQKDLSVLLYKQLLELKATNVFTDEFGYVYATVPSNIDKKTKTLAFLAHVDTSNAVSGKNVNAQVVENYQGGDIVLNKKLGYVLKENADLKKYIGQDIVTTDGTTLLGADDKAGVAIIMTMVNELINGKTKHGDINICFTPDEEVGAGVNEIDLKRLNSDYGFTVDGGELGELEYENFNAAALTLTAKGISTHPGTAKGMLVNALDIIMEFNKMLPEFEKPQYTEKYEGFFHLDNLEGCVDNAVAHYIIRDHDKQKFEDKKELAQKIAAFINDKYKYECLSITIEDSYYNMKELILPHFHLVENAVKAMEALGIKPRVQPIRGGTDGSKLSYMGLPCPNLFTGGHNFHGRYEYISLQSMDKCVDLLLKLCDIYAGDN